MANVLQALEKADRFTAKAHILRTIDSQAGDLVKSSRVLHVTPKALNASIDRLDLREQIQFLITRRKYNK